MKKSIGLTLGLMLVAGGAFASNTGFKLNYQLQGPGGTLSNLNWVSPPYFFWPNTNVGTAQTGQDWCVDLNGAVRDIHLVVSITKFDSTADGFTVKNCSNVLSGFTLSEGMAYGLTPGGGTSQIIDIVGSMDDTYAPNKGGTNRVPLASPGGTLSNLNWVSVPYHTIANNAQDLCVELNGAVRDTSKIVSITNFDSTGDGFTVKNCSNVLVGFVLDAGKGYGFTANPAFTPPSVAFNVY